MNNYKCKHCGKVVKSNLQKAQIANLELINEFCNLIHGDYRESLEETNERFVGFSDSEKGTNTCEVFEISNMYINLYDVFQFYLLDCSIGQFSDWYWQYLETRINLKRYLISAPSV